MSGRDERLGALKTKAKAGTLTPYERGELRALTRGEARDAFALEPQGDNVDLAEGRARYERGRERARSAAAAYSGPIAEAIEHMTDTGTILKNWREGYTS